MLKLVYDKKIKYSFDFNEENLAKKVVKSVLLLENIKYDISVSISLVSSAKIKTINKNERNIDKVTDVLSFPNIDFKKPSDFRPFIDKNSVDISIIDLYTNTIFLGDIVLCKDKILSQAKEYGHSVKREFAFLILHSMLHLLGYDHMTAKDEKIMFGKQDILISELRL